MSFDAFFRPRFRICKSHAFFRFEKSALVAFSLDRAMPSTCTNVGRAVTDQYCMTKPDGDAIRGP